MADFPPGTSAGVVGDSAAEQAGSKALRSDALSDRAANPAAVLGSQDRVLEQKALKPPATAAAGCTLTAAQFKDKLMGMMLLGAYGDALGAGHEALGLKSKIAADPIVNELKRFDAYAERGDPDPFGAWVDLSETNAAETGMVTDDTGVKVMILYQFLRVIEFVNSGEKTLKQELSKPNEALYEAWLNGMKAEPSGTPPAAYKTVLESRKLAIAEILCWFGNAKKYAAHKAEPKGEFIPNTCRTKFWTRDVPVVFGHFLYLELAAIYACCDRAKVLADFRTFSVLDMGEAKFSTGMLAAVLSQAFCADGSQTFTNFFNVQVEDLLKDPDAHIELKNAWVEGIYVGTTNAQKTHKEIMEAIKAESWVPRDPEGSKNGLGKYRPSLFLAQMAAAVQWGDDDPRDILGVLAFGVGDADTIPAHLGSIIGAFYGEKALRAMGLSADLDIVQGGVEKYFAASAWPGEAKPFRYSEAADCLQRLAAVHGCCG